MEPNAVNTTGLLPEQVQALNQGLTQIANTGVAQQRNALMGQQLAEQARTNRATRDLSFAKNALDRDYKQGKIGIDERLAKSQELLERAKRLKLVNEANKLETEIAAMKALREKGEGASYGDRAIVSPSLVNEKSGSPVSKIVSDYLAGKVPKGSLGRATGATDLTERQNAAILQRVPSNLSREEARAWAAGAMQKYREAQRIYREKKKSKDEQAISEARQWIIDNLHYDPESKMIR